LDDAWRAVRTGPFRWKAGASRQIENFTDLAHFPFVHPGLLGDPTRTEVPHHEVRTEGHILFYDVVRPEAANTADYPVFANRERARPERRSRYQLHLPFTIVLRLGWGGPEGMLYFFASQPVNDNESVGYCIVARNYNLEQPDEVLQRFEEVIFGQDQRIVESQRPHQVPFDLAAELHLRSDAVAVAYRRAMSALRLE
jgi:vanillate O-demethylase monooxygenase subunit